MQKPNVRICGFGSAGLADISKVVFTEDLNDNLPRFEVQEISVSVKISDSDWKDIAKLFAAPKGYRNAHVLKRDGFLSPWNMEF